METLLRRLSALPVLALVVLLVLPRVASAQAVTWTRGYPEIGPSGCVDYVAQWSDGTYTATPWDCRGGIAQRGDLTATRGYPQLAANGCTEYVTQWSDGSYTWVPFSCPAGVTYFKPEPA